MNRNRSLMTAAAALAIAAGLVLAQDAPAPPDPTARMEQHLDRIGTLLNLTDNQKTQVKSIFESSFSQAKPIMTQLRDNRQAIEQLVKGGSGNFDQQLQTLANTQGTLTAQLTTIHAKALAQVWNLLNADQRTKAEQLRELFHGFGGPGGPGGAGAGMMMHHQGMRQGPPMAR